RQTSAPDRKSRVTERPQSRQKMDTSRGYISEMRFRGPQGDRTHYPLWQSPSRHYAQESCSVVSKTLSPQSSLDPEAIASLRNNVQGSVYLPDDAGYDDAVRAWAAHARHSPNVAVMPETDQDVARAVALAHRFDLPVAVQVTGHGVPRS